MPKNDETEELEGKTAIFHRDQPGHGRKSHNWPDYREISVINHSTGVLSEQLPGLVLDASYRVPSDIEPEFRERDERERLQSTRQDTASAGQANNLDQGLLALAVAASLSIPMVEKPGKHSDTSKEGAKASPSRENIPSGCPTEKQTKRALKLSAVRQKPQLAVPYVEQLDTADGVNMSAIAKIIG